MAIKISFCIALNIIITINCYANEPWPSDISYYLVTKYVQQKQDLDMDDLQAEYDYVLTFLEKAMEAYKTNIVNYYTENSLIKRQPAFENGALVINEFVDTLFVGTSRGMREKVNILVLLEYSFFSLCFSAYNQLVDFWYDKTGLLIRNRLSLVVEEELWTFIVSNDTNIEERALTSVESDTLQAMIQEWETNRRER
jgi:hypothetical protein